MKVDWNDVKEDYKRKDDEIEALKQQLADLKASLPKVRADAVLSLQDAEYTCETPNGGRAWSSSDIEEHADKLEAGNE